MNSVRRIGGLAVLALGAAATGMTVPTCGSGTETCSFEVSGYGMEVRTKPNGSKELVLGRLLPPGYCVRVTLLDGNGKTLEATTVQPPAIVEFPLGTTGVQTEIVPCEPLGGAAPSGPVATIGGAAITEPARDVIGMPVELDWSGSSPFKNAAYHFRVRNAGSSALDEVLPILLGGPGTPVPTHVEVVYFCQTLPDGFGARLRWADTASFAEFRLDWNGTVGYAELASAHNLISYAAGNGWKVLEVAIPATDFLPIGESNQAMTTSRTMPEATARTALGRVRILP